MEDIETRLRQEAAEFDDSAQAMMLEAADTIAALEEALFEVHCAVQRNSVANRIATSALKKIGWKD